MNISRNAILILTLAFFGLWNTALANDEPTINNPQDLNSSQSAVKSNPWVQTLMEAIRAQMKADGAFIASAYILDAKLDKGVVPVSKTASALLYPDDEVAVLLLKGDKIKAAFERALSLYPQRYNAFLQIAGMTVEFNPNAKAGSRVLNITIGGAALDNAKEYRIATVMPLARGALGYFRIWDKNDITQSTGIKIADMIYSYLSGKTDLPIDNKIRIVPKE